MRGRFEELKQTFKKLDILEGRQIENEATGGWQPPPRDYIKINTNVAMRGNDSTLGLVARNSEGKVIEVHALKFYHGNPMTIELSAIKEAIQLSVRNGWRNILCESDVKTIIQCLDGENAVNLHLVMEPILKEIRNLCISFDNISIRWCSRLFNRFALIVAKWVADNEFTGFVRQNIFPKDFF